MNTSGDKITNVPATDPIDIIIHEKGLRIKTIFTVKELDLLLIILNNGKVIKSNLSISKRLKNAPQKDLDIWRLRGQGTGIRWEKLDEDLSLRGFIKEVSLQATLHNLQNVEPNDTIVV